jgi:hypothetical protein
MTRICAHLTIIFIAGGLGLVQKIVSVTLLERTPVLRALQAPDFETDFPEVGNQLILFDL